MTAPKFTPTPTVTAIAAARALKIAAQRKKLTFEQEFKIRIGEIARRMEACGSNWNDLCALAKVSRAQPNRYAIATPKTIQIVDRLEAAVGAIEMERRSNGSYGVKQNHGGGKPRKAKKK